MINVGCVPSLSLSDKKDKKDKCSVLSEVHESNTFGIPGETHACLYASQGTKKKNADRLRNAG